MAIKNVAIVGLGALGILYGKHFTDKIGPDHVRVIVNEERKKRYEATGIYANGEKCNFQYVDETTAGHPADLVLFAVKGTQLTQAIDSARNQIGPHTILISVLNGISSEEALIEAFGGEKVIHCVAQGMDAVRGGNALSYNKMGELRIGIDVPEKQAHLDAVVTFFDETAFPYTVEADITYRLWKKFMMNVGLNQALMVTEGVYGDAQSPGETRDLMIAAMREVLPIANVEGVALTEQDLSDNLDMLAGLAPDKMPSMRQDGLARRKSEVDLFAGTVLEKAKHHQLPVPTNRYLYDKVKEIEATY